MSPFVLFSSDQVPEAERRLRWESHMLAFCGPSKVDFGDQEFSGRLEVGCVADIACARALHTARRVHRDRACVSQLDDDALCLMLQFRGRSLVTSGESRTVLGPNDIDLFDPAKPGSIEFQGHNEHLFVRLPRNRLNDGAEPQLALSRVSRGVPSMMISSLLRAAFDQHDALSAAQSLAAADALLGLVRATWRKDDSDTTEVGRTCTPAPLLRLIHDHIIRHLATPDLDSTTIAAAHGISVRHVHRLFAAEGTSLGDWIRQRRLDRCAAELRDPEHVRRSITEIAFKWGFNESAHFSRSFKAAFGCSPREYRLSHQHHHLSATLMH